MIGIRIFKESAILENFSVEQSLIKAQSYLKRGELAHAQELYETILQNFSNNKRAREGLAALNIFNQKHSNHLPSNDTNERLVTLYNQGQFKSVFTQSIILLNQYPNTFIVWKLLGLSAVQIGMLDKAVEAFRKCILLKPDYIDGYINIGFAFQNQGRFAEAIRAYKKCISLKPDYAEAYSNMGNSLKNHGKLEEAIDAYKKCISLKPDYAEAFSNMGIALNDQGKLNEALEAFNKALLIKPDYAEAYSHMSITLKEQGKLGEAIKSLKKAIFLKPNYLDAFINIGVVFKDQGNLEESIKAYQKCLKLRPDNAEVYSNMGNTLKEQGKLEDAVKAFNKSISLKPDYAEAYSNMGIALHDQGKLDEAIEVYKKALSLKHDYVDAYYNNSFSYNLKGDLKKGLELYEWRLKKKDVKIRSPRQDLIWDGIQSVSGKYFLVYEEQGLGDIIQVCRYLPLLKQKGAKVTFKVQQKMHALLETMNRDIVLVDSDTDDNEIDFETPLMSLPFLFNTILDTIPSSTPYLFAEHDKVISWGKYLTKPTFKIGICWQGSKGRVDIGRSFPLSLFKGISELPNVELISLQKGDGEEQIKDIDFKLTTLGDNFDAGGDAFTDTAAVMVNCDLIITSDTATAHLAGALGCRTWVVLKDVPDWRWMLDRTDSLWYPDMTLYRQIEQGNWNHVFNTIQKDLLSILKRR